MPTSSGASFRVLIPAMSGLTKSCRRAHCVIFTIGMKSTHKVNRRYTCW